MLSRRQLLAGSAVVACSGPANAWFHHGLTPPSIPVVQQGALSGAGYNGILDIANDGSILLGYDGANCWKWNNSTSQFDNVFSQTRVPASYQTWGAQFAPGARAVAQCPTDSSRAYAAVAANGFATHVWKTSDGCNTWVDTGYRLPCGVHTYRGMGPNIAVDPANKDIVYISDDAGVIHFSNDAGVTWSKILYSNLPSAVTNASTAVGSNVLHFSGSGGGVVPQVVIPATTTVTGSITSNVLTVTAVTTLNSIVPGVNISGAGITSNTWVIAQLTGTPGGIGTYSTTNTSNVGSETISVNRVNWEIYASNISTAIPGISVSGASVIAVTATSVTLQQVLVTGDSVSSGDTIVFGGPACIAFDTSGGTTTVGGQTRTKNIWVGWSYGAAAMVNSTDGGVTFGTSTGSPPRIKYLACSPAGVVWACDSFSSVDWNHANVHAFNLPGAPGTWTDFTSTPSAGSGSFFSAVPDPNNAGHVALVETAGGLTISADNGTTWHTLTGNTTLLTPDGTTWMQKYVAPPPPTGTVEISMSAGKIVFDPSNNGRLYFGEGIGLWRTVPDFSGFTGYQWSSQNKNQQGFIVVHLVKPPGNRGLLLAGEDRVGYLCTDPTVEPTGDFGIFENGYVYPGNQPGLREGWAVTYCQDNPDIQYCMEQNVIWKSTNAGQSWSQLFLGTGNGGMMASGRTTDIVAMGTSACLYSNDSGATTHTILLHNTAAQMPGSGFGGGSFTSGMFSLLVDPTNSDTYYAFKAAGFINTNYYGIFNTTASLVSGGSGYAPGDTFKLDVSGIGTGNDVVTDGVFTVDTVSAGVIQTFHVSGIGQYRVTSQSPLPPTGTPLVTATLTGAGSGATINMSSWIPLGGVWKSTDRGVNWSSITTNRGGLGYPGGGGQMNAVSGNAGHLFLSWGVSNATPLYRSVDGGVTLAQVTTVAQAWYSSVGPAAPGKSYPSVIIAGTISPGGTSDPNPSDPGVWITDTFDGNVANMPQWKRLCRAPGGNMDGPSTISADPDVYGKFYIGCGGTGYAWGQMS